MSKNTPEVKHVTGLTMDVVGAMDAQAVEKLISSIGNRGQKLQADMHKAACACLNHAALHNDPTLLNRLVLAMPKSSRRNSLLAWAMKFGNVALNDDKATKAERPLVYLREKKAEVFAAIDAPFWELKNVKEGGDAWVYTDYIKNVMTTLKKQAEKGGAEGEKARTALAALSATLVVSVNAAVSAEVAA